MTGWKQLQKLQRAWQMPLELNRSRPREVRLTRAGKALAVLVVALAAGAVGSGAWLLAIAERDQERLRQLREEAVMTEGEIIQRWRGRGEGRPHLVIYEFAVGDKKYQRRAEILRRAWLQLDAGARVTVRYVPSRPEWSRLPGLERSRVLSFWVVPILPLLLLGGAGLAAYAILRQRRLLAEGRAAPALVLQVKKVEHRHPHGGRRLEYKVRLEFAILSGARVEGEYGPVKKPPSLGSILCVLYDPECPRRIAPYPLSLVRPQDAGRV